MKKYLFAATLLLTTSLAFASPETPSASKTKNDPEFYARSVAVAQVYRYGREMYRAGNYPESVKAFKKILSHDCHNSLAHYHLQKIATLDPNYKDLNDYLASLHCGTYNFSEQDFLPAGALYEKDEEILRAQMAVYSQRARNAKKELHDRTRAYDKEIFSLESKIRAIADGMERIRTEKNADTTPLERMLTECREATVRMDAEVSALRAQAALDRVKHQDDVTRLKEKLWAAQAKEKEPAPAAKPTAAATQIPAPESQNVTAIRQELAAKEELLAAKDMELETLQAKFDMIRERLKIIEAAVKEKDRQIKDINNELRGLRS